MEIRKRSRKRWQEPHRDIERIETVKKYGPYEETVEVGQTEVQKGYCPPLRPMGKDIAGYEGDCFGIADLVVHHGACHAHLRDDA